MKYIHHYNTEQDFQNTYYGEDYNEPWVSLTETAEPHVDYNKTAPAMPTVDLGLQSGNLWAEYNLGASSVSEPGEYYAWAELSPKTAYTKDNYEFYDAQGDLYTKYNSLNTMELQPEDDVVYATLGDGWSVPKMEDFEELTQNCTISYIYDQETSTTYAVYTSNINGNSIRFVDNGYYNGQSSNDTQHIYLWAHRVIDDCGGPNFSKAEYACGSAMYGAGLSVEQFPRYYGIGIRPIFKSIG